MYDLIIKNGTVIDGTGEKEKFKADVAVQGGKIVRIGFLGNAEAVRKIDASGKYVTPGFIDVLNHSDTYLTLFSVPGQESLVSQGVTTVIGGNCGYSLAPLVSGGIIDSMERWTDSEQINIDWLRTSEYLERLRTRPLGVNFGTLTGYNTITKGVLKNEYRQPSSQENEITAFLLDQSLEEGSFGLSFGLAYLYQDRHFTDHLEGICKTVKKHDRLATVHLRDEADKFLDSLTAMLHLAREEKMKLHVSHLKVAGKQFWPNFRKAITMLEEANRDGADVTFDVFPYATSALMLYLLLPAWVKVGGPAMIQKRLQNSFDRLQVIKDLKSQDIEFGKITIASRAPDAVFIGKTLAEVAEHMEMRGEEAIIELLLGSHMQVVVFAHALDEHNVEMGIGHPLSFVASSGAGYHIGGGVRRSGDLPHPRAFGTFPRFLRKYVREKPLLSWERGIQKITGAPARRFGIGDRGVIREGLAADIAVFDPHAIADAGTFQNPSRQAKGVHGVVVNGVPVFSEQEGFSGIYSGKVLPR